MRTSSTSPRHPSTPPSGSGHRSGPGSPTPVSFVDTQRSINARVRAMNVKRAKAWAVCMFHTTEGVVVVAEPLILEMKGKGGYFVDGEKVAATKKELFNHAKDGQAQEGVLCNTMVYDAYMKDLKVFKLKKYAPAIFTDIMAGGIGRADAWALAQDIVLKKEQPMAWALKEIDASIKQEGASDKYTGGADDYAALEEDVVHRLGRTHGAKLSAKEEKAVMVWLAGRKERAAESEEEEGSEQEEDAAALRGRVAALKEALAATQAQLAEALQALQDARGKKRPREENEAGSSEDDELSGQ